MESIRIYVVDNNVKSCYPVCQEVSRMILSYIIVLHIYIYICGLKTILTNDLFCSVLFRSVLFCSVLIHDISSWNSSQ